MTNRANRGVENADFRSSDVETGERTCRSCSVRATWASSGLSGTHCCLKNKGRVYMRVVCPRDVKKMLRKLARTTYWRKWASRHDSEELMEGVRFDPLKAMLRKKIMKNWTDKHRNVL